ncbi:Alpha/Beta hydrolase protein [Lentinula detonsa]|uniref:Dipeptidyl-peptidase V n=1 Tax=Lentinula detonsa TaxID=2804962 RepID=A0A9W8TZT1_9AGAR|nr:Alpha/Beta hydrolase protein [Lentinula detonsa]
MRFSFALSALGLTSQVPLQPSLPESSTMTTAQKSFQFVEGPDVFTPKDLVELGRTGAGVANQAGDFVLIPYSKFSFEEKKNHKNIYVAPLESSVQPFKLPLTEGGEAFWLNGRTLAYVLESEQKTLEIFALDLLYEPATNESVGVLSSKPPVLLGTFPTTSASNFRYSTDGYLVFSDSVYPDGNLTTVKEQDEAWENRGNTALVYDHTYERHWDHWVGPKTQSLFSVRLVQDPDHKWTFGSEFVNLLAGTEHSSPVEPFGGTDDFDVSKQSVIYTTLDPAFKDERAWHTKQNVYIVGITGGKPRELTSGSQGATHNPVLNHVGDKAAWLELDEDGYESDRAKIVIYDLKKNVRFTLTQKWDRSPGSLVFSKEGEFIYFTAGDHAKVKVFVLPIPSTPEKSTTDPQLSPKYLSPVPIVKDSASSGLQSLPYGRILISKSSFTSPNDVYLVKGLDALQTQITQSDESVKFSGEVEQVTNFTASDLEGKNLSKGEEFWFKGADDIDVQGWILKPKGWKKGETKAFPVVLLIHGGPQGAWEDQWSTRWNPNVFAQQGYFTVAINPTGSTSFGQAFTDAIAGDWGGKPFVDLQKGWKYILESYPEIDSDRAVAAGASWGGYAINWIQGHPEYNFGFKALVCHDGVFDSSYNGFSTEELFFFNHDWRGRPWDKDSEQVLRKFNPVNFVHKWGTPQLVIHGSKDYRLPETDGIGAFHALQQLHIPSRLVIFPNENHWVLNHGNSLKWHYEVFRWFDQFVGKKD